MNFESEFEKAPIEEKKLLVRKCISHIIVDREKPAVRFYVRRIPAATPWLEETLKINDRTTGVVRSSGSGDRNFFQGTTFEYLIQLDPELEGTYN
jgi:hypothetical protein